MDKTKDTRVSREQLYEEVWAEPMTTVALKYKVSSSFLARICTRLKVPRPQRGYWAMYATGKRPNKPPLPAASPGDELEWARDGEARREPLKLQAHPLKFKRRKRSELPALHPLLAGFQDRLNEGRDSIFNPFIRPIKRLLPDIITSKKTAQRIIDVANELYLDLEAHGHQVKFSPHGRCLWRRMVDEREKVRGGNHNSYLWSPSRPTLLFIGSVAIGLTVYEMTEYVEVRHIDGEYIKITDLTPQQLKKAARSYSWTSTQDMPSGRLCIQASSPYPGTQWAKQWQEKKAGDFPDKLPGIIRELEIASATIAKQVEEAEHKAEIQRKQYEQQCEIERQRREEERRRQALEEAERRRVKAIKDSRDELSDIIKAWAKAKRIVEFFADVEHRTADLEDVEKAAVLDRLTLARKMVDTTDALKWLAAWKTPEERNQGPISMTPSITD
ncbi:hypothetical protein [Trichlorobacter lovleyi]|uniref:Uncharacterized protein n=1 Tax=Trichlorobacter lovleyi (strain ATCC BAA-1151 / DSM 17278 / SZ) TaxID=398767 RepID=B3E8A2_TRIL1|nr:hypothetical protein [Trichlorobacter lovleyi]ACD95139.1 hypothetical protein Glov_1418 [Trichlorobacter lovleyi SZ]